MEHKIEYRTEGVCAKVITFELDEESRVHSLHFSAGCSGNTAGLSRMVEGMPAEEVVRKLKGTPCKERGTSCPDQLAQALAKAIRQNAEGKK